MREGGGGKGKPLPEQRKERGKPSTMHPHVVLQFDHREPARPREGGGKKRRKNPPANVDLRREKEERGGSRHRTLKLSLHPTSPRTGWKRGEGKGSEMVWEKEEKRGGGGSPRCNLLPIYTELWRKERGGERMGDARIKKKERRTLARSRHVLSHSGGGEGD